MLFPDFFRWGTFWDFPTIKEGKDFISFQNTVNSMFDYSTYLIGIPEAILNSFVLATVILIIKYPYLAFKKNSIHGRRQSQGKLVWKGQKNCSPLLLTHETYKLIHIRLWNFKDGGSWKAIFLAKNQHIERKLFLKYPLMNYGLSNFRCQKSIISSRTRVAKALIVVIMLVGQDMFFFANFLHISKSYLPDHRK